MHFHAISATSMCCFLHGGVQQLQPPYPYTPRMYNYIKMALLECNTPSEWTTLQKKLHSSTRPIVYHL